MIKLSDYVFQFLQEKGVQYAFMLPGGGAMHLDDSIGRSGIQYICTLHEQAAAVAAEAYAQHTNRIGVCPYYVRSRSYQCNYGNYSGMD